MGQETVSQALKELQVLAGQIEISQKFGQHLPQNTTRDWGVKIAQCTATLKEEFFKKELSV